jgi:hypothetical protein
LAEKRELSLILSPMGVGGEEEGVEHFVVWTVFLV